MNIKDLDLQFLKSKTILVTGASRGIGKALAEKLLDLGNIVIGYTKGDRKPVHARELNANGAMAALLKDAIKPNFVQTLENNLAIVHGGPFANIAHGCNSVSATQAGLKLADYVITEAGFGTGF